jgi:hypothetical protein
MSQLNIRDLYSTINQKTIKRMEIYDETLQKCHRRIKYNADLQRTYCFFQIPEFIIGVPLFNPQEMRTYVINSLKTNGFQLIYVEPNWLFISWDDKGSKILIDAGAKAMNSGNSQAKPKGDYKSIDSYKPTGSFIYDQSTMMGFGDKLRTS